MLLTTSSRREEKKGINKQNTRVYALQNTLWLLLNIVFDKQIGTKKRHVRRKVSLFFNP